MQTTHMSVANGQITDKSSHKLCTVVCHTSAKIELLMCISIMRNVNKLLRQPVACSSVQT